MTMTVTSFVIVIVMVIIKNYVFRSIKIREQVRIKI